jgi:hypothetical protein
MRRCFAVDGGRWKVIGGSRGMIRAFNGVWAKEKSSDTRRATLWRYGAPRFLFNGYMARFSNVMVIIIHCELHYAHVLILRSV